jgi:acyl-CoA dehydrogenase
MNCDLLISQQIVINGRKWWISGAGDPRNAIHLVMGKSDTSAPKHSQQSIVIVPSDTPGVKLIRPMQVFGYDELSDLVFEANWLLGNAGPLFSFVFLALMNSAPEGHFEVLYEDVRVPIENLVYDWGKGFEIVQSRLGPGRIHHW